MLKILCPDCLKGYTIDLTGKEGQRFRCGVCSCYFYVTDELVVKIAELDTYSRTERNVVCPYCGITIKHPFDSPMGCYECTCGEVYHLRKFKHSVSEDDMQTQVTQFDEMMTVSEDTIPLPEVTPSSPTQQMGVSGLQQGDGDGSRIDADEDALAHKQTVLDTSFEFTVSDTAKEQKTHPKFRGICDKLTSLRHPRTK